MRCSSSSSSTSSSLAQPAPTLPHTSPPLTPPIPIPIPIPTPRPRPRPRPLSPLPSSATSEDGPRDRPLLLLLLTLLRRLLVPAPSIADKSLEPGEAAAEAEAETVPGAGALFWSCDSLSCWAPTFRRSCSARPLRPPSTSTSPPSTPLLLLFLCVSSSLLEWRRAGRGSSPSPSGGEALLSPDSWKESAVGLVSLPPVPMPKPMPPPLPALPGRCMCSPSSKGEAAMTARRGVKTLPLPLPPAPVPAPEPAPEPGSAPASPSVSWLASRAALGPRNLVAFLALRGVAALLLVLLLLYVLLLLLLLDADCAALLLTALNTLPLPPPPPPPRSWGISGAMGAMGAVALVGGLLHKENWCMVAPEGPSLLSALASSNFWLTSASISSAAVRSLAGAAVDSTYCCSLYWC
mmetsp:Transcript_24216/g.53914  ORF Transcript_24216/g.53914 Transcript_24216/m.53914 type:complete len:407 (-) Transcript_24216:853-2073(-)